MKYFLCGILLSVSLGSQSFASESSRLDEVERKLKEIEEFATSEKHDCKEPKNALESKICKIAKDEVVFAAERFTSLLKIGMLFLEKYLEALSLRILELEEKTKTDS